MTRPEVLRGKHRLRTLEARITGCLEERHEISQALSNNGLDGTHRLRYECRVTGLALDVVKLWSEYRKLAKSMGFKLEDGRTI